MYAIISTGGKQLTVHNEDVVAVERLAGEVGSKIKFDKVLAVGEGEMKWQVVKVYTMPDFQRGVKIMRIA